MLNFAGGKSFCWWDIVRILLVKRAFLAKRALLARCVSPGKTQTAGRARISGRARIAGPNANYRPHVNCRPNAVAGRNAICWYLLKQVRIKCDPHVSPYDFAKGHGVRSHARRVCFAPCWPVNPPSDSGSNLCSIGLSGYHIVSSIRYLSMTCVVSGNNVV